MSNKTEVLSFDDWAKLQGLPLEKDDNGLYINRHTHYARKGWEAKPEKAEIDELKKNFNNALKTIEIQQRFLDDADGANKIITSQLDELQKRIESAMEMLEYNEYVDSALQALEILKGGVN